MIEFLDALQPEGNGRFTELRSMRNGEVMQTFIPLDAHSVLAEGALHRDSDGWDVYFGVVPREYASGKASDCVQNVGVLWADIDNKAVGGTHLAALMRLGAINLTPSIVVDSGNGIHAYWLLNKLEPFSRVQPLMKGLQSAIGSDHVHDAPRVLRLPGTRNHKDCPAEAMAPNADKGEWEKVTHGGPHCNGKPVRLLHFEPERRYRLSDFDDFTPVEQPERNLPHPSFYDGGNGGWEPSNNAPPFPEGTRNASLTRLAGIMFARGMAPIDVLAALLHENNKRCSPPLPPAEVERIVRSVSRYAK